MLSTFSDLLKAPYATQLRRAKKVGVTLWISNFCTFGSFGLAFYYGGVVVDRQECTFNDMFKSLTAILFCGIQAGIYGAQLPQLEDAKKGVRSIIELYKSFSEPAGDGDDSRHGSKGEERERRGELICIGLERQTEASQKLRERETQESSYLHRV